jgi:hypothetical protein
MGPDSGAEGAGRSEGAVAVAQQHTDASGVIRTRARVADSQVQHAVAVEVSNHHTVGLAPDSKTPGSLEAAVSVGQEHLDGVAVRTDHNEVWDAVPVEIPRRQAGEVDAWRQCFTGRFCLGGARK